MTDGIQDKAMPEPPECWLSILIPVFNVAPYVRECVLSVMHQQPDTGVEVILLDDCSSDNSWQICQELAGQFPNNIRLMQHTQNRGLSAARNTMIDAARGEYIGFLDSDDYLIGKPLIRLKNIIALSHSDVILFDYKKRKSLFKKSFPGWFEANGTDPQKLLSGVFAYRKMYAWLKVSKRTLWSDDLRFPEGKAFEDIGTIPQLLLRCKSYTYVPRGLIYYRIRPNSIMSSVTRTRNFFDACKNDDLAGAMLGFPQELALQPGGGGGATKFYASHFLAKEYCKLAKRYVSAHEPPSIPLIEYLHKMEKASPLSFGDLQTVYLKRMRIWDYFALKVAVAAAHKGAASD